MPNIAYFTDKIMQGLSYFEKPPPTSVKKKKMNKQVSYL
jgi:hypothetical protein